jgi:hypothetical protein
LLIFHFNLKVIICPHYQNVVIPLKLKNEVKALHNNNKATTFIFRQLVNYLFESRELDLGSMTRIKLEALPEFKAYTSNILILN